MIPSVKKFIKFASKTHPEWDFTVNEEQTGFVHGLIEMAYQGYLLGRQSFSVEDASMYCLATATEEGLVFSNRPVFRSNQDQAKIQAARMRRKTGRPVIVVGIHVKDFQNITAEHKGNMLKMLVKSNKEMKDKPKKIQRKWTFFEPDENYTSSTKITPFAKNEMTPEVVGKFWQNVCQGEINLDNPPEICYRFAGTKDMVAMYLQKGTYAGIGDVTTLNVSYLQDGGLDTECCAKGEKPKPMYYTNNTQYFHTGHLAQAIECFIGRIQSEHPIYVFGESEKLETIRIRQSGILQRKSHYDYLDEMLNPFWMEVFGETEARMFCGGMVSAHGDKAYSYRSDWDDHGIPFHHGVLLFLLTYTKERGETPKHKSCEWVIENYARYFMKIQQAEREVLKEVYRRESCGHVHFTVDSSDATLWCEHTDRQVTATHRCETEAQAVSAYLERTRAERIEYAKKLTAQRLF